MRRHPYRLCVGLALAAGLLLWAWAEGQVPPGRSPYDLYRPEEPANPLTGRSLGREQANPLTGEPGREQAAVNPLTRQPLPQREKYNPLTGSGEPDPGMDYARPARWPGQDIPVRGKAGPGLDAFDRAVQTVMDRHGIPAAALAVAKDGRLVYAKGIGWADLGNQLMAGPETIFGLASLSKPITAMAVLLLIEQGKLGLDDLVLDRIGDTRPPEGGKVDVKWKRLRIGHLLNHTGGWDRDRSGDPANMQPQIARALGVGMPVTPEQFVSYMLAVPLDFEPGTRHEYSNVGYIILGHVIERVSGRPYADFIRDNVLSPCGMRHTFIDQYRRYYQPGEALRYLAGTGTLLPPMQLPMASACGGWNASAVDMARLLTSLDGSRGRPLLKEATYRKMIAPPPPPLRPRANGTYPGLGWPDVIPTADGTGYAHAGNFHGMRTFLRRSPQGVNWALLFNVSMQPDTLDTTIVRQAVDSVRAEVEALGEYPDVDLFQEF